MLALLLAYQPVKALGNLNISIQEGLAGAERIFELLDTSESSFEKIDIEKKDLIVKKGQINIENLSFAYNGKNVLEKLNLLIPAGKKVAIVGLIWFR